MNTTTTQQPVCSHRHAPWLDNFFRKLVQSPAKVVGPYLKPGDTALDLGCGPGFFTIPMAELVGRSGTVIGIDLQKEMLEKLAKKADAANSPTAGMVVAHRCSQHSLELDPALQADFILACYMVHETVDQEAFFREVRNHLKASGRILVIEPPFHVTKKTFAKTIKAAEHAGLIFSGRPKRKGGFSALFAKAP